MKQTSEIEERRGTVCGFRGRETMCLFFLLFFLMVDSCVFVY